MGQIVTITSGKGGVGKTSITINVGLALVQQGHRVCVVDADTNLANINIMLKQVPDYTLEHVINGEKSIREVMQHKHGLTVVPAATGISSLVNQGKKKNRCVIDAVASIKNDFDYVLIDTASGINDSVLGNIKASHRGIFVITSEPTSLTDSYSLLKILFKSKIRKKIDIVVNYSQNEKHAMNVHSRFSSAVEKYMAYKIGFLGFIFRDDYLSSSVCFQNPLLLKRPDSKTSQCFRDIALNLHAGVGDRSDADKLAADPEVPNQYVDFSSAEKIERTVSLANLENDLDQYMKSSQDSKDEIELTMKKLADKYQQVFSAKPASAPVNSVENKKQAEAIKSLKLKSQRLASKSEQAGFDPEYQAYLGSIHIASLLGDYAECNHEALH